MADLECLHPLILVQRYARMLMRNKQYNVACKMNSSTELCFIVVVGEVAEGEDEAIYLLSIYGIGALLEAVLKYACNAQLPCADVC